MNESSLEGLGDHELNVVKDRPHTLNNLLRVIDEGKAELPLDSPNTLGLLGLLQQLHGLVGGRGQVLANGEPADTASQLGLGWFRDVTLLESQDGDPEVRSPTKLDEDRARLGSGPGLVSPRSRLGPNTETIDGGSSELRDSIELTLRFGSRPDGHEDAVIHFLG